MTPTSADHLPLVFRSPPPPGRLRIWPFALNAIQFSDPFIPQTEFQCAHCIEVKHKWIVFLWMTLLGAILVLPFWGILMLIRCRLKLDAWLEYSLARLSQARRGMKITPQTKMGSTRNEDDEDDHDDTKDIVCRLVNMVAECQEYLGLMWTEECSWLVHTSTSLLWISAACGTTSYCFVHLGIHGQQRRCSLEVWETGLP